MALSLLLLSLLALLALSLSSYRYYTFRRRLPPGPLGLPLIGNLHQAPSLYPWRVYTSWRKRYGPLFSLQYGPTTLIVIGSHRVAHDLLEKRSAIYSSRPRAVMVHECISKGYRTLNLPYGTQWRTHHRLQASLLNIRMSALYRDVQDLESKQLVRDFLATPDDDTSFSKHFHRYSSSLIFALAYGKRAPRGDEPEIQAVDTIMHRLNDALLQTWIVDMYPMLNALPTFLAPWKRLADRMHAFEASFFTRALSSAEARSGWNWAKQLWSMKESHHQGLSRTELAYVLGVLYEAGSDTTTMVLEVFVLAAVLHRDAVRKAQAELDRVVGPDRLPRWSDLENLPYVHAFMKEVLRWRPIIPGGVPHAVTAEDEYMGYRIPGGATVMVNVWAMCMDGEVYKDPERFWPERWILEPGLPLAAFGFGRRKCIGQHVGTNSLLINISRLLWTYDISHPSSIITEDPVTGAKATNDEIDPLAFTNSFNSNPLPFRARFTVRSARAEEVVREEWEGVQQGDGSEGKGDVGVLLERVGRAVGEKEFLGLGGKG